MTTQVATLDKGSGLGAIGILSGLEPEVLERLGKRCRWHRYAAQEMIRTLGDISYAEMFHVYNMGIGFCFVVAKNDVERTLETIKSCGFEGSVIGHVDASKKNEVHITPHNLVGKDGRFK